MLKKIICLLGGLLLVVNIQAQVPLRQHAMTKSSPPFVGSFSLIVDKSKLNNDLVPSDLLPTWDTIDVTINTKKGSNCNSLDDLGAPIPLNVFANHPIPIPAALLGQLGSETLCAQFTVTSAHLTGISEKILFTYEIDETTGRGKYVSMTPNFAPIQLH